MSGRSRLVLWAILAAGTLVRLAIAFATQGDGPDIRAYGVVGDALTDDPLHVYGAVNDGAVDSWPYPSGYFPWIAASVGLHNALGPPFHGFIQVAPIVADCVIAWIVQDHLGRQGASDRLRLVATAAVALGPSFAIISGYQSQFDAVAILPGVAAILAWERFGGPRRALWAGALIGLGGALKITPLLLLLALLPTTRSVREAATLMTSAGGVVLLAMAPYLLSEPMQVLESLGYAGLAGVGGVTLALQPALAENWLMDRTTVDPSWLVGGVAGHGLLVSCVLVALITAFVLRCRPGPIDAAIFIWLAVYAFSTGFFFQYMIWGLPFFLLGGHVKKAIALQAALLIPAVLFYMRPWEESWVAIPYAAIMIAVWAAIVLLLASFGWRLWTRRPRFGPAVA